MTTIDDTKKLNPILSTITEPAYRYAYKKLVFFRLFKDNVASFLFQYIGLMLTRFTPHPSVLWLFIGASCALIFMRGTVILPGIFLGSLIAGWFQFHDLYSTTLLSILFTVQPYLLFYVTCQLVGPTLIFYGMTSLIKFICITIIITALTTTAFSSLVFQKNIFSLAWWQWWLANVNSILIFSIAIITLDFYFPQINELKAIKKWKLVGAYTLLLLLSIIFLFKVTIGAAITALLVMFYIGKKWGWCGAVFSSFLVGMVVYFADILQPLTTFTLPISIFLLTCCLIGAHTASRITWHAVITID